MEVNKMEKESTYIIGIKEHVDKTCWGHIVKSTYAIYSDGEEIKSFDSLSELGREISAMEISLISAELEIPEELKSMAQGDYAETLFYPLSPMERIKLDQILKIENAEESIENDGSEMRENFVGRVVNRFYDGTYMSDCYCLADRFHLKYYIQFDTLDKVAKKIVDKFGFSFAENVDFDKLPEGTFPRINPCHHPTDEFKELDVNEKKALVEMVQRELKKLMKV